MRGLGSQRDQPPQEGLELPNTLASIGNAFPGGICFATAGVNPIVFWARAGVPTVGLFRTCALADFSFHVLLPIS